MTLKKITDNLVEALKPLRFGPSIAADRIKIVLAGVDVIVGRITHPNPANPKANKEWEALIRKEFSNMGIRLPDVRNGSTREMPRI